MGNKITYTDKVGLVAKTIQANQWWDSDANEVKEKHNLNDNRITAVETGQLTGIASYATLLDLPGTGTVNVVYKVTNDTTSSNNGYYHWDGAIYVKDLDLAFGTIASGDTDAVSGDTVYIKTTEIETDITSLNNKVQTVSYPGYTGVTNSPLFPYIETGKEYKLTITTASTNYTILIYDEVQTGDHDPSTGNKQTVAENLNGSQSLQFKADVSAKTMLVSVSNTAALSILVEEVGYNTITVKTSGGDYDKVSDALSAALYGQTIEVYEGTYDILDELGGDTYIAANPSGKGMYFPDGVKLIGIGDKNKIIITSEIVTQSIPNQTFSISYSTLNVEGSIHIENCLIKGKNVRYCIHDESGGNIVDGIRYYKDVDFIYEKVGNYSDYGFNTAYGWGSSSGQIADFINCKFISPINTTFLCHDNANFTKPTKIKFNTCEFTSQTFDQTGHVGLKLSSYNTHSTEVINECIFLNCISQGLTMREEILGEGNGIWWNVTGSGNNQFPIYNEFDAAHTAEVSFNDEHKLGINYNGSAMTAGTPVYGYNGGFKAITLDAENYTFAGILTEDANDGEVCKVKYTGFIPYSLVSIVSVSVGDKIGIVSGVVQVVVSADYIAVADSVINSVLVGQGFYI